MWWLVVVTSVCFSGVFWGREGGAREERSDLWGMYCTVRPRWVWVGGVVW